MAKKKPVTKKDLKKLEKDILKKDSKEDDQRYIKKRMSVTIGRGWWPDFEPFENEFDAFTEKLLRERLQDIFKKIADNPNNGIRGGRCYG